jgi:IMP cyclohydrolase
LFLNDIFGRLSVNNPDGPYPGRQIFIGLTAANEVCFAYLITGRAPESRERKAIRMDNIVAIGPLGNLPYDPLRHYSAVKYDISSSVLAVSNGVQTEAVYETYKLLVNTGSATGGDYLEKILDGADAELDSYHTPRIAGVILPVKDKSRMRCLVGIKTFGHPAKARELGTNAGTLEGISTYKGDSALSTVKFSGKTAADLAQYVFDISETTYQGNDIRVSSIGGVMKNGQWELALKNAYQKVKQP